MVAALAVAWAILAVSQPPSPSPRPKAQAQQSQAEAQPAKANTVESPRAASPVAYAPDIQRLAEPPQQQATPRNEEAPIWETRLLAWANAISTLVMAFFTVVLAKLTKHQKILADRALASSHVMERAYVNMSHKPPGLHFDPDGKGHPGFLGAILVITNHGRTPARVIGTSVGFHVFPLLPENSLPTAPPYRSEDQIPVEFFLMPTGKFFQGNPRVHLLTDEQLRDIQDGQLGLWLLGYVDYIDIFERPHRGGYARRYEPAMHATGRPNLVFETQRGYNYDDDVK